jgi:transposase
MSQSLLYHAFGIKGVTYRSAKVIGNGLVFCVETTNRHVPCDTCGHRYCHFKGHNIRWFRMAPIGRKQDLLQVTMHRLRAMDMSTSCTSAVRERLPDVPIVFDRYLFSCEKYSTKLY